jgi:hypothetical protein
LFGLFRRRVKISKSEKISWKRFRFKISLSFSILGILFLLFIPIYELNNKHDAMSILDHLDKSSEASFKKLEILDTKKKHVIETIYNSHIIEELVSIILDSSETELVPQLHIVNFIFKFYTNDGNQFDFLVYLHKLPDKNVDITVLSKNSYMTTHLLTLSSENLHDWIIANTKILSEEWKRRTELLDNAP